VLRGTSAAHCAAARRVRGSVRVLEEFKLKEKEN
jgi:hypothetical protein